MKESIFPKTSRSRITYEERCTIETLLNEASMLAIIEKNEKISLVNIKNAAIKTNCIIKL